MIISCWRKRWWVNYTASLGQWPDPQYGGQYGARWREWVNEDLIKYRAQILDNNQIKFRSQADYEWFLLKWR